MKNILGRLSLFVFLILIASCSNENKEVTIPVVKLEQITLDLRTNDGYLGLGSDPMYKLLTDLPEWLSVESITADGNYKLRFLANGATDKRRDVELELERREGNIKVQVIQNPIQQKGLYILSEAGWGRDASDIAYYDELTGNLHPNYFSEVNGRTLGDVGNDMMIYGSRMYVVVSGSDVASKNSYIEVIDPTNLKSMKQIPFIVDKASGTYDLPRRMVADNGKLYITGFTGIVARLDTLNLEIEAFAKLGEGATYSEGLAQVDGKLYVCNSGYGKGKTISVVDMKSFKETSLIEIAQNPVNIIAAPNGKIYFQTALIFDKGISSNLYELDPKTNSVTHQFDVPAGKLTILNNKLYTGDFSWITSEDQVSIIDLQTKAVTDHKFNEDDIFMVYSFDSDAYTPRIFVGSQGDDVLIMDEAGRVEKKLNVEVPYINKVVSITR